jgi:hypothetical protein
MVYIRIYIKLSLAKHHVGLFETGKLTEFLPTN